jgi:hypothetical protein
LTGAYLTRATWYPSIEPHLSRLSSHLPERFSNYIYHPLSSTFEGDAEAGLTSANFDLAANIAAVDSRPGLDDDAKREIKKIMRGTWWSGPVDFDEARRIYFERCLEAQGIGKDGRSKDPKAVTFS